MKLIKRSGVLHVTRKNITYQFYTLKLLGLVMLGSLAVNRTDAQELDYLWSNKFGSTSYDRGNAVTTDVSGNILTVGQFYSTVDFDPGTGTTSFTSPGVGGYIQKLNGSGGLVWVKELLPPTANQSCLPRAVATDGSGNVYVAGQFYVEADFEPGAGTNSLSGSGYDGFLLKLNSSGDVQWVKQFESNSSVNLNAIAIDASNNIYVTGTHQGTIDLDPGTGTNTVTATGSKYRLVLVKLDDSGDYISGYSTMESSFMDAVHLSLDNNGDVIIGGHYFSTISVQFADASPASYTSVSRTGYVLRLNATTETRGALWKFDGNGDDYVTDVSFDASNNMYVAGYFETDIDVNPYSATTTITSNGGEDGFIIKMSSGGAFNRVSRLGGSSDDRVTKIYAEDGYVHAIGTFQGTVDFDPYTGTTNKVANGTDGYIWTINTNNQFTTLDRAQILTASGTVLMSGYKRSSDSDIVVGSFEGTLDADPSASKASHISAGASDIFQVRLGDNHTPTDITFASPSIDENNDVNDEVGTLSTVDADAGDTHTYALVSGTGDTDNASFQINGNKVEAKIETDYEVKSSYSVRIETSDGNGGTYSEAFTITVNDRPEAPTDLTVNPANIDENSPAESTVGSIVVTDQDSGDSYTLTLVSGHGDDHNELFYISKGSLVLKEPVSHEKNDKLYVRIRADEESEEFFIEKQIIITINDVPEAPTNLTLGASSIAENQPAATAIGTFSTTDQDAGETYTYTFASGDNDNASFSIVGAELRSAETFDFETQSAYSIRVNTNDGQGGNFAKDFTINIIDVFEGITWNGSSWSNGTGPGAGSDDVEIAGDYNTADHGTIDVKSLIINSGVTFTVAPEDHLYVVEDITNNGALVIESGADLMSFEAGTFMGNAAIIKRNTRFADGRYSFVGTPVAQTASVTHATLGSHVYVYDESQSYQPNEGLSRWVAMSGELVPGVGYTQAKQQEIVFEGVPNVTTVNVNGTYTGTYNDGTNEETEGWVFIANPYTTAIDVADFLAPNTNIEGSVYIWDDNGSNNGRGTNSDYIVANGTMATNTTPGGGQVRYNQRLGSAQAFFVKLSDDTDTEISFTPDMRVTGGNADDHFFRKSAPAHARINLTNTEGLFKQTIVAWVTGIDDEQYDRKFDARTFNSKSENLIYTKKGESSLAIQGISYERAIVKLGVNVSIAGMYTIELEDAETLYGQSLYLHDLQTAELVDLSHGRYTFNAEAGQIHDRFELMSSNRILGFADSHPLNIYAHDRMLYVNQSEDEVRTLKLISLSGKEVLTRQVTGSAKIQLSLPPGVYIATAREHSHKIILK